MATLELPYPRADWPGTVGDVTPFGWVRLYVDKVQQDPTSWSPTVSTQQVDDKGNLIGDPSAAVSVEVKPDPEDQGENALLLSIDATGLEAGKYRWELRVEGTTGSGATLKRAFAGGYITLVERLEDPS